MHLIKLHQSDYGKVKAEALREDGYESKVGTIDESKTHLNFSVCSNQTPSADELNDYIAGRGVKRKVQANAVKAMSLIVDLPEDESCDDTRAYFTDITEGVKEYFGISEKDILYAEVHMDEGHPHMHLSFLPTQEYSKQHKDGHTSQEVKLSAKEVCNPVTLQQFHPWMQKYMCDLGYDGTLHRNDGVKRDKEFIEHKREMVENELERARERLTRREQFVSERENALKTREKALDDREARISTQEQLEAEIKRLNEAHAKWEERAEKSKNESMKKAIGSGSKLLDEIKRKAELLENERNDRQVTK